MRDDLTLAEQLHRGLLAVRWPEPAEIRARARRRSRRTVIAAATAVLVVASAAVAVSGGMAGPRRPSVAATVGPSPSVAATVGPSPSVAATVGPSPWVPAEVPLEVLLVPSDVHTRSKALSQAGLGEKISVDEQLIYCHRSQRLTADWEPSRYSRSVTLVRQGPAGAGPVPGDFVLSQDVYRVAPDVGVRLFAGLDTMLAACDNWRSRGPTQWQGKVIDAEAVHRWQVVDRNFAGGESVLLRHSVSQARNLKTGQRFGSPARLTSTAVVRAGDLVAVINVGRDGTERDLRRLATVAASRMCAAANPPC
ncbi:hypothetical protein [Micromonospora sp. NPDC048830]|uniref:hypothetical protein n=1 Tax=Micromonospora sp. NPDC048830 TaxID=3364257 RepID=UPI003711C9C6